MAKYNEILSGRFNNALKKFLSMKGPAPSPQISGEFMAVIPFFFGAETRFLEEWSRFGAAISQAAVAGQQGEVRLRNPSGANVVSVLEKISVSGTLLDQPFMNLTAQTADLATVIALTNNRFDNRGRPTPALIASRTTAAAPVGATHWQSAFPNNGNVDMIGTDIQEFPLLPGDAITIVSNVANQALNVSIWWRERALEASELQ